ncbi:4Fe-4S dicluster domain-containing protein [Chloroflexota bacterium]
MSKIQFIGESGAGTIDDSFALQVRQVIGEKLDRCYQCFTCSLGCPVSFAMDYHPDQIIRMVHLGLKQQVLSSSAIWMCPGCETCVARCPNEVDILRVMDTLREMAIQEGIKGKESVIPAFHQTFLSPVRLFGRQYDLGMLLLLKWRPRDLFSDLGLGIRMLLKGKLAIFPDRIKGSRQVKEIFDKTRGIWGEKRD